MPEASRIDEEASLGDPAVLARRIVAAHVPGRGLHVVGTSLGAEAAANGILIALGRALADKGRSIIVDLNRSPAKLADLVCGSGDGRARVMGLDGLAELLAGDASFAEVIHRDEASRLHFIPAGRQEADFRDFDLILDALSETYDFIVMLTPAYPQSEIAKIMAPYADFVVIAAATEPDHATLAVLETELIEAGAHEVLVAGIRPRAPRAARDVA
jgi:Mrp family chromosome partitioning ATPase